MRQVVLLKAIEEGRGNVLNVRLLHHQHTLKVRVHSAGLDVRPDGHVGIVTGAVLGVDAVEAAVEEVVEALVDGVGLRHDHRVALCGRVADGSYGVHLGHMYIVHQGIF